MPGRLRPIEPNDLLNEWLAKASAAEIKDIQGRVDKWSDTAAQSRAEVIVKRRRAGPRA